MALSVTHTNYQLATASDFEAGRLDRTAVTARMTGRSVYVPRNCFSRSNHYIKCSRDYIRDDIRLDKYLYVVGLKEIYIIYSFICFFAWLHSLAALAFTLASIVFCMLFCQYMYVGCRTIPLVKKQPLIHGLDLDLANDFVEVSIDRLSAEYVQARNAGFGIVGSSSRTVEFQVLGPNALDQMYKAKSMSVGFFLLSLGQIAWGCLWSVVGALNHGSIVLPPLY